MATFTLNTPMNENLLDDMTAWVSTPAAIPSLLGLTLELASSSNRIDFIGTLKTNVFSPIGILGTVNEIDFYNTKGTPALTDDIKSISITGLKLDVLTSIVSLIVSKSALPFVTSMFAGDDVVTGSTKADILLGFAGNDVITGNAGNDKLYGNDGNDVLTGGAGRDILVGGLGSDTFVFNAGDTGINPPNTLLSKGVMDAITDFKTGVDHINLHSIFAGTSDTITQVVKAGSLIVSYDSNHDSSVDANIQLTGVKAALPMSDFIF